MKKLRKLSLLLVLELGCMGAAMPGIVESEATATNNSKGRRVLVRAPEEPFVQSENPGSIEQTTMDYSK